MEGVGRDKRPLFVGVACRQKAPDGREQISPRTPLTDRKKDLTPNSLVNHRLQKLMCCINSLSIPSNDSIIGLSSSIPRL